MCSGLLIGKGFFIMSSDTIAAIASGLTPSGIGIIRVSGQEAADKVNSIFEGKDLTEEKNRGIFYGHIKADGNVIDEVIVLVMRAPKSYTGENVCEIQCHGGPFVMQKILKAVLDTGVRPAEPGEFTKRAFLSGRLDLAQAEAVMDIIRAENEKAAVISAKQISGDLSDKIRMIREMILHDTARIEASLDDPERLSLDGFHEEFLPRLKDSIQTLKDLADSFEEGRILTEGIKTVILGKPNVGKSSIMNRLLGEERAIVTEYAGTTRDVIEENLRMSGFSLKLVDTAGIHDTDEPVEKIGIEKASAQAKEADLIFFVADSSDDFSEDDEEILSFLSGEGFKDKKVIVLLNKSDLIQRTDAAFLRERTGFPVFVISAKEAQGIEEIKKYVSELFMSGKIGEDDQMIITNVRHQQLLKEAAVHLEYVKNSIADGMPEDFYTIDLMAAYEALGKITGETAGEDLVNEIFSKFCMGK